MSRFDAIVEGALERYVEDHEKELIEFIDKYLAEEFDWGTLVKNELKYMIENQDIGYEFFGETLRDVIIDRFECAAKSMRKELKND